MSYCVDARLTEDFDATRAELAKAEARVKELEDKVKELEDKVQELYWQSMGEDL